jgi:transcriptional regulator with XRE-family HTH domain
MDKIQQEISKNITILMDEQNLNVESLSLLSTLSENTITKLLSCDIKPTIGILQKICNVFSMNTCQFFDEIIMSNYINPGDKEVV